MTESPAPIDSQASWEQALLWGFRSATAGGARTLTCVDRDFVSWPLDDVRLLEQLTAWLRLPQRRLLLLAAHYDDMLRCHPRFCAWRRDWSHALEAWQASEDMAADLPRVLLDDQVLSVALLDPLQWRGRAQQDARAAHLWRERAGVILKRAERAFAVNTLGL